MSSITEETEAPPKPKSGVRGLRGLARKKTSVPSQVKDSSQVSGLYSGCVKKCFDAIKTNSLSEEVIHAIEATQDVEDDLYKQCAKKKSPPVLLTVNAVCVSDDEDEENERCMSSEITYTNTYASASPPPPPSPPKGKKRRNTKSSKTKKKLMSAVQSFTKSISDAQSQFNVSDLIQSPDVEICLSDDVTVRVSFHGKIHRYTMSSDAPFSTIMSQIATQEDVEERLVMLVHNDKTLRSDDTPVSVKLHIADILECHINHILEDSFTQESASQNDPDVIELVVQSRGSKRREFIKAHLKKPLSLLIDEYAHRMNAEASYIQMFFDGEQVSPKDTPESLDMEEGDMLDVKDAPVLIL